MTLAIVGILALVVLVAACVRTTRRLWRAAEYERGQKIAQTAIIWCVPVLGVLLVRGLLGPQRRERRVSESEDEDDDDDGDAAEQSDADLVDAVAAHGTADA